MTEDVPMAEYDVTCQTEGCSNAGHTIRVMGAAETPQVICGPCGQPITDVVVPT